MQSKPPEEVKYIEEQVIFIHLDTVAGPMDLVLRPEKGDNFDSSREYVHIQTTGPGDDDQPEKFLFYVDKLVDWSYKPGTLKRRAPQFRPGQGPPTPAPTSASADTDASPFSDEGALTLGRREPQ